MGTAKVVTINARPLQASHLCFEVDGILAQLNTHLGAPAAAFDFTGFYATLASAPTSTDPFPDPSRLRYDAPTIQSTVLPSTLAWLRAEPRKVALNKAVNARQNTYYAKYANASDIMGQSPAAGLAGPSLETLI